MIIGFRATDVGCRMSVRKHGKLSIEKELMKSREHPGSGRRGSTPGKARWCPNRRSDSTGVK